MSDTKHLREVREIAEERGWDSVERSNGGHLKVRHPNPDVGMVVVSSSPSGGRWRDNFIHEMRRQEREAGLLNGSGPEDGDAVQDADGVFCQYCGAGPYENGKGLGSHERTCDDNPDVWKNCRYCYKPCKGPAARTRHERYHCPERPGAEQEEDEEREDEPPEEVPIPEPSVEVRREQRWEPTEQWRSEVRKVLLSLLHEYEDILDRSGPDQSAGRALREHGFEFTESVEVHTDLIGEVFGE